MRFSVTTIGFAAILFIWTVQALPLPLGQPTGASEALSSPSGPRPNPPQRFNTGYFDDLEDLYVDDPTGPPNTPQQQAQQLPAHNQKPGLPERPPQHPDKAHLAAQQAHSGNPVPAANPKLSFSQRLTNRVPQRLLPANLMGRVQTAVSPLKNRYGNLGRYGKDKLCLLMPRRCAVGA